MQNHCLPNHDAPSAERAYADDAERRDHDAQPAAAAFAASRDLVPAHRLVGQFAVDAGSVVVFRDDHPDADRLLDVRPRPDDLNAGRGRVSSTAESRWPSLLGPSPADEARPTTAF